MIYINRGPKDDINSKYSSWRVYRPIRLVIYDILYKMIYWLGINIGNWRFYEGIDNIKSAILNGTWHKIANI